MNTNYEKDLNDLKEQILKDGDTLISKRDLLERFCEMDKEYNGEPWNLLQILANINILVGEEPCKDAISKAKVFEIMGNLMSIPYDLDRRINEKDVSESMDEIRTLPPVNPTQKWIPVSERLPEPNRAVLTYVNTGKSETFCLANRNDACGDWEEWIGTRMLESEMEYKVLAWLPLPKPYNAEMESEE